MTADTLAAIRERHYRIEKPWMPHARCGNCEPSIVWPCDAARLLALLDLHRREQAMSEEMRAALDRIERFSYRVADRDGKVDGGYLRRALDELRSECAALSQPPQEDGLDVETLARAIAGIGVIANGTWVNFEREDAETIAAEYARLRAADEGER